jgi:hypothetical protein
VADITETSRTFPCACGQGRIYYTRQEHDFYPNLNAEGWDEGHIDCAKCSARLFLESLPGGWFFVPKDGGLKIRAQAPGQATGEATTDASR